MVYYNDKIEYHLPNFSWKRKYQQPLDRRVCCATGRQLLDFHTQQDVLQILHLLVGCV